MTVEATRAKALAVWPSFQIPLSAMTGTPTHHAYSDTLYIAFAWDHPTAQHFLWDADGVAAQAHLQSIYASISEVPGLHNHDHISSTNGSWDISLSCTWSCWSGRWSFPGKSPKPQSPHHPRLASSTGACHLHECQCLLHIAAASWHLWRPVGNPSSSSGLPGQWWLLVHHLHLQ